MAVITCLRCGATCSAGDGTCSDCGHSLLRSVNLGAVFHCPTCIQDSPEPFCGSCGLALSVAAA